MRIISVCVKCTYLNGLYSMLLRTDSVTKGMEIELTQKFCRWSRYDCVELANACFVRIIRRQ